MVSEHGKAGCLQHRDDTKAQIERLEQVALIGKPVRRKACEAIQKILVEGKETA